MKTVLITGASSGIGAAAVRLFAQDEYAVALTYRNNAEGADRLVNELVDDGYVAACFQADLCQEDVAERLVTQVHDHFGRIDVLVNNAGGYIDGDEWNGAYSVWEETFRQNLFSMMNVSKHCVPIFEAQQAGVVVNVASRLGVAGDYEELAYGAAKAGVINLTQSYAKLLAPYGRANTVSPGMTEAGYWLQAPDEEKSTVLETKLLGALVRPEVVANMLLFLGTDRSAGVTGQNYIVG